MSKKVSHYGSSESMLSRKLLLLWGIKASLQYEHEGHFDVIGGLGQLWRRFNFPGVKCPKERESGRSKLPTESIGIGSTRANKCNRRDGTTCNGNGSKVGMEPSIWHSVLAFQLGNWLRGMGSLKISRHIIEVKIVTVFLCTIHSNLRVWLVWKVLARLEIYSPLATRTEYSERSGKNWQKADLEIKWDLEFWGKI